MNYLIDIQESRGTDFSALLRSPFQLTDQRFKVAGTRRIRGGCARSQEVCQG